MSHKVVAEFAVGQIPDLDQTIPSTRDDERNRLGRREPDTGNPFSVTLGFTADLVLAFSESIPQANSAVSGTCLEYTTNGSKYMRRHSNDKSRYDKSLLLILL